MKENVFVIMGVDFHLPRIKKVIASIKEHHRDVPDIAISNYGVLWPVVKPQHMYMLERQKEIEFGSVLRKFAEANGFCYYQPPKETFDFAPLICPNDEALSMIQISHHFYQLGYSYVFILQNDIHFFGDTIAIYKRCMKGKWSFIAPLHSQILKRKGVQIDYKKIANTGAKEMESIGRLGIDFLIFNREFIYKMYEIYGTERRMWDEYFSKVFNHSGDLVLCDILSNHLLDYTGIAIPELGVGHGCSWIDELGFE